MCKHGMTTTFSQFLLNSSGHSTRNSHHILFELSLCSFRRHFEVQLLLLTSTKTTFVEVSLFAHINGKAFIQTFVVLGRVR